jgi:hypothetical protein
MTPFDQWPGWAQNVGMAIAGVIVLASWVFFKIWKQRL